MSSQSEIKITKIFSTIFKFIALGFVFIVPATYAISLQLLGTIIIVQILPAVFFGLYIKSLRKQPLIGGLLVGIFSGIFMLEYANNFGALTSSVFNTPFGPLYIAIISLVFNLAISFGLSALIHKKSMILKKIKNR